MTTLRDQIERQREERMATMERMETQARKQDRAGIEALVESIRPAIAGGGYSSRSVGEAVDGIMALLDQAVDRRTSEAVMAWVREDLPVGAQMMIGFYAPKLLARLKAKEAGQNPASRPASYDAARSLSTMTTT